MDAADAKSPHYASLDGLRGLAILLVVLPHAQLTGTLPGPDIIQRLVHDSGHGVELFFVLSGFGLASPLLRRAAVDARISIDIVRYAFNRAFRIVPLFYLALFLCMALNQLYIDKWSTLPATLAMPHNPFQLVGQFLFLDRDIDPVNSNFWSIPVQLRWYLAFPLLLSLYLSSRRAFMLVFVALVIAYNATRLHQMDIGTLPLFMLGIFAADLTIRQHPFRRWWPAIILFGLALGHLGDRWASFPDQHGNEVLWTMQPTTLGWQIAAFGLVIAATSNMHVASVLRLRLLQWLGVASFSIYLIHEPVVEISARLFGRNSGLLCAAAGIAAGGLLWFCAERRLTGADVRRALFAKFQPFLAESFAFLGIPPTVRIFEVPQTVSELAATTLTSPPGSNVRVLSMNANVVGENAHAHAE
jgi:peptidoglycan/LPS O-acetylase OafA/YrhL